MNKKNLSFFLLGFQRIFIHIRSQIQNPYNIALLEKISEYSIILSKNDIEYNMFTTEIHKIVNFDEKLEEFFKMALNNINISFETDNLQEIKGYLYVLRDTCLEICIQLKAGHFDRAYDLVDAIHCLPEAILSKKKWNSTVFWNTYIEPYRKKWDMNFLAIKEKELVKHRILIFKK